MNSDKRFLLVVLVVISLLTLFVVLPVLEYVLLSIILAYVLHPVHTRLREYIGTYPSALVLIATAIVAIVVPVAYILWVFVRDLTAIATGESEVEVGFIEERIETLTGVEVDLVDRVTGTADGFIDVLFGGVTGILSTALQFFIGVALVLFLVFYLLVEGEDFVVWLEELSPLPTSDTKRLFGKVHRTMWGAVIGHTFAALVQALVAGIGLWIAGVGSVVFWTVVMAILAFLPLIGAFLVWAPASVWLVATGNSLEGAFLFLYGITIVSMIDYYARPLVIDQQARLNPGVILVGVFGGILTFGFVGLFVGPILIGVLAATLETIKEKQLDEKIRPATTSGDPGAAVEDRSSPHGGGTESGDTGEDLPPESGDTPPG